VVERKRLGVIGWPVAHSLSPAIHNAALHAAGLHAWRYQLLPLPPVLFAETVKALGTAGFRGVNVTIPHKLEALALAGRPTRAAAAIGAANTLLFEADGTIAADNTDAPALVDSVPFSTAGRTALVLGAGGSARAAVWALLDAGAAKVMVLGRTAQRARALCDDLGGAAVRAVTAADILVNCTPIGMDGPGMPLPCESLREFGFVVDFVYRSGGTPLINQARSLGIGCVDGVELLVAQAALAFMQFTGRRAPVAAMRAAAGL
jgi:shikimate dehydrogenase